ncbi:MAG: HPr(Ser) kinase/phosphatase [Oscillospiraceae bacterium]|nr:HPr(Ser) kinase/phosphatase [Oscillospiraceae bacterium]
MTREFSFPLKKMIEELKLEVLYMPENGENSLISNNDTNRPGLQLAGFYDYFDNKRVQVMGKMEHAYLEGMESEKRRKALADLLSYRFPALVISRSLNAFPELMELAPNYEVPILRTEEDTTVFIAKLMAFLTLQLAPRITRHGVLIEIYGEGVMIMGESGVGKSETAVELVKRGHRLIADDAVEIRKASNITLVGSSPDNIRHFLELRGIGIVNARQLFGIGAVKTSTKIDMVVEMELWNPEKTYDRMGVDTHYMTILGVKVPLLNIPVKPGRNLAVILEVAAMNNRQKKMGYNAAKDLLRQLGMDSDSEDIMSDLSM